MRFLNMSLVVVAAAVAITACAKSNEQNQSNASATAAATSAATTAGSTANAAATTAAAGEVPSYPSAVTQASGSGSNMGTSATGTVMTTDDSFDKVYAWYQKNMPAGSEKSHVTSPIETAVFTVGDPSSGQTSVTITVQGAKTMITIGKVKM